MTTSLIQEGIFVGSIGVFQWVYLMCHAELLERLVALQVCFLLPLVCLDLQPEIVDLELTLNDRSLFPRGSLEGPIEMAESLRLIASFI